MAGEARTSNFLLGTATVMVGPQADLMKLDINNSIGLVKNFTISTEPSYAELTQGVKNSLVYSIMTGNAVKASAEVYEYTSKNLAYALGLGGSTLVTHTPGTLTTAITAGGASITATFDTDPAIAAGDWVMVTGAEDDRAHIGRVASDTFAAGSETITLTSDTEMPTTFVAPIGSKVVKVNVTEVGSKDDQPFLAAKIVGVLPEKGQKIVLLLPKFRITQGFNLNFSTDGFQNMPFEFQPYDLVTTDPFYTLFRNAPVKLFTAT